ncbi:MAG TPA: galactokinase [Planctomycetota bacterium]
MPVTTRLRDAALALHRELTGGGAEPRLFFAPGRVNLLGAHVDYNGGVVMPAALSRGTCMAISPRADGRLRVRSSNFPNDAVEVALADLRPGRTRGWSAYLEGAVWSASRDWGQPPGLDVAVCADLPMAKGLSSSASIECVTVFALAALLDVRTTEDEMIRLAHDAETCYVGVRCGILDQAAILLAKAGSLLHFDCLELTREHLPFDAERLAIAVVDSGMQRELASSAFNQRVAECTQALAVLQEQLPGVTCLRDVKREDFERLRGRLRAPLERRVQHVVEEVERTMEGAMRLRAGDLEGFGALVSACHRSLRDAYEVSTPELDVLAEASWQVDGCLGARLAGAGFGGCVVALVDPEATADFEKAVPAAYAEATGRVAEVRWFRPSGGPFEYGA